MRGAALLAAFALLAVTGPAGAADCEGVACVVPIDLYEPPVVPDPSPSPVTTNSYPEVRDTTFVGIPLAGVTSRTGGVIAIEHVLHDPRVGGGTYYLPCKAAPTMLPNVEAFGGEPYKQACTNPESPSYFRHGTFGAGASKRAPVFDPDVRIENFSETEACITRCEHHWANRTAFIAVEIYLKKTVNGRPVTDFNCVRPRFHAAGFSRSRDGGLYSVDMGTIKPVCAYERGASRLQGYVFAKGSTYLEGNGRLVFSVFQNDATGRSSTGQPLQAFSAFQSAGGYYTTGVLYAGYYMVRIRDTATNRCVLRQHTPIKRMGERVDIHLDRAAFGIRGARDVPC